MEPILRNTNFGCSDRPVLFTANYLKGVVEK